jgi:hypothetical protein
MLSFLTPLLAAAGDEEIHLTPVEGTQYDQYLTDLTFGGIIQKLIQFLLVAGGIVFFFMLLWGGIQWIMSGGDKGQTEAARNRITAALVGLVIVFAAWAIASLIKSFFGIDVINPGSVLGE